MAIISYTITFNPTPGSFGTLIEYKADTDSVWITPSTPSNPTSLATYPLTLETGIRYTIRISSVGINCTKKYKYIFIPVDGCCPDGYTLSDDGTYCYIESVTPATVEQSDICLAPSQLAGQYSSVGTQLMSAGYDEQLNGTSTLLTSSYWKEAIASVTGPMNREAVWVDTDCDGTKDGLTAGSSLQITFPYTVSTTTIIYIGIGGDNTFQVDLNGDTIVCVGTGGSLGPTLTCPSAQGLGSTANFNFWWLFPVTVTSGTNYFTFRAIGDGSTNDSFGAVIYENTPTELATATSDGDLNIVFQTSTYIGEHIDIASCPSTYFLDTTGGTGNYVCRKFQTTAPQACDGTTTTTTVAAESLTIYAKAQSIATLSVAQVYYSTDGIVWNPTILATVGLGNTYMVTLYPTPGDDLYFAVRNNVAADITFGEGNGGAYTGFCGEDTPFHYGIFGSTDNVFFNLAVSGSAFITC